MLLNFDQIEEKVIPKMRGGEGEMITRMFVNEDTKIMRGRLTPGSTIGLHTHEGDSEMIFILSGAGKVLCDGAYESLAAGSCHYCPKGHEHSLINDGTEDLEILAMIPTHGA